MRAKIIALALTAAAVAGCDKTTDPTTSLSAAEVRAIVLAIDDAGSAAVTAEQSGAQPDLIPTRPAPDLITREGSFNFSGECDLGGTAALVGNGTFAIDSDAGTLDLDIDATGTYVDCAFKTKNDVEIAVGGAVAFAADRHVEQGLVNGTHSYVGSLDYETSNGKQGTCPIDIAASFSLSEGSASRTLTGNVCDQAVDVTDTWTAGA